MQLNGSRNTELPIENLDRAFAEAMRSIGGVRPSEISLIANDTENADIVLRSDNLIIEVKTLMEDPREKLEYHEKHEAMYKRWEAAGKVPFQPGPTYKFNTQKIPLECAIEYLKSISISVKTAVKKANDQIKATKISLNMPAANGLLVICNTGNSLLQPDALLNALHHTLGIHHSAINWLIYMTHNHPVQIEGMPHPVDLFTTPSRENHGPMPAELAERIQMAWMRHISAGRIVTEFEGKASDLRNAKQLKPSGH